MLIDLTKLRNAAGQTIPFEVKGELESLVIGVEVLPLEGQVEVRGEVFNTGRTFQVKGTINACFQRVCGRCLKSFTDCITADLEVEYCRASEVQPEDRADERDDFEVFEGNNIDLTERVKEALYLAIPMRALCREDCRGMCAQCGQDFNQGTCGCQEDNIDPRFKVLEKLLKS